MNAMPQANPVAADASIGKMIADIWLNTTSCTRRRTPASSLFVMRLAAVLKARNG